MNRIIRKIIATVSLSAVLALAGFGQTLSDAEKKVAAAVDKDAAGSVDFLEKAVNIESPTENLAGVKEVGMLFKKEFDALGFKTRWIEMPPEMKRAGHLLAEKTDGKGKRILLLGHLDTVLKGEKFRREGNMGYGTGIADMKGGDVVILYALKALAATGALREMNVTVLLTGDEEDTGDPEEIARRDMVEAAKRSDLVLSYENGVAGTATVARRGIGGWELEVTGNTGHSSQIFSDWMGSGSVYEASRILEQFYEAFSNEKYLTVNPALIVGGTKVEMTDYAGTATAKTNVVAGRTIVRGDFRFISSEQAESARKRMQEIVAKSRPQSSAKITFTGGMPAMPPTEGNYNLLKQLDQVSRDLGLGEIKALDPGSRGAGDISYVAYLLPGLDGLGAMGSKAHAVGEYAELDKLPQQTKRTALLLYRLAR
ncbi:MAG: M20/M25/M40 family metallo-hydrolase [Acidobacteria bacterium]|nr:M20/M25/M40 family metallo-hydrolase [Acidobacteriota bacterium]